MKFLILLLLPILGILFIASFHQADAKLLPDSAYLLQGNGFVITKDSIEDSEIDFDLLTGKLVNSRMKINLEDAVTSLENDDYVSSNNWQGTALRDSRFLILSGNAQNSNGDEISLNLLARLIDDSKDGSVYSITGKITKDNEVMKVVYTAKIVGTSAVVEKPTTEEKPPQEKTIQINILSGSSNPGNKLNYYSLDTVTISPGTIIIWKNEDSVPHTILSGVASFSPGKPFTPDGKINSGDIAPGKTFKVTINDLGITRFFDSKYTWMDGVIISLPEKKSTSLGKNTETALDTRNKYLNKPGN
jgi:plastocyanin